MPASHLPDSMLQLLKKEKKSFFSTLPSFSLPTLSGGDGGLPFIAGVF